MVKNPVWMKGGALPMGGLGSGWNQMWRPEPRPLVEDCLRLDVFELRAVDVAISDDMLQCLDALRRGCADLHTLVPDGDRRMQAVIARWGLRWPEDS